MLKVFRDCLLEGFQTFLELVPLEALIVCKSNSLREVVKPSCFIMMNNQKNIKKTAKNVIDQADIILKHPVVPNLKNFIVDKKNIHLLR